MGGATSGIEWRTRLQVADVLTFTLSRVRLSADMAEDVTLLEQMPSLIGELRAAARPLINELVAYANSDEPPERAGREYADRYARLLRGVIGGIWGFAAALRAAGRPLPASGDMIGLCSRLLDLAPERGVDGLLTRRAVKLSEAHGASFRVYALGVIGALEFESMGMPTHASLETARAEEADAYTRACITLGIRVDDRKKGTKKGTKTSTSTDDYEAGKFLRRQPPALTSAEAPASAPVSSSARDVPGSSHVSIVAGTPGRRSPTSTAGDSGGGDVQKVRETPKMSKKERLAAEKVEATRLAEEQRLEEQRLAAEKAAEEKRIAEELALRQSEDRFVAIKGNALRALRQLSIELLSLLEVSLQRTGGEPAGKKPTSHRSKASTRTAAAANAARPTASGDETGAVAISRVTDLYATAMCAIAPTCARELLDGDGLGRLMAVCDRLLLQVEGEEKLVAGRSVGVKSPPPELERRVSSRIAGGIFDHDLKVAQATQANPDEDTIEGEYEETEDDVRARDSRQQQAKRIHTQCLSVILSLAASRHPAIRSPEAAAEGAEPERPALGARQLSEMGLSARGGSLTDGKRRPGSASFKRTSSSAQPADFDPRRTSQAFAAVAFRVMVTRDGAGSSLHRAAMMPSPSHSMSDEDLERLVRHLNAATDEGVTYAAAIIWLQANAGGAEVIGHLGGTASLAKLLHVAVIDHKLDDTYVLHATWVAIALWRLCEVPASAKITLEHAGGALLEAVRQSKHAPLRTAALACVARMIHSVALVNPLRILGAMDTLHHLASTDSGIVQNRMTATRTLHHVDALMRYQGTDDDASVATYMPTPEAADEEHRLNGLMVALLDDASPRLRAMGCRGVGRSAMLSAGNCKELVELDAPRRLVSVLKPEVMALVTSWMDEDEDSEGPGAAEPKESVAEATEGIPEAKDVDDDEADEQSEDELLLDDDDDIAPELLHDVVNATLNLSAYKVAQGPIARYALWPLLELWHGSQVYNWSSELLLIGTMAGETLSNLAQHQPSYTLMYRAELQLKMASWSGASLKRGSLSPRGDVQPASPGSDSSPVGQRAAALAIKLSEMEQRAQESSASNDMKQNFVNWLDHIDAEDKLADLEIAAATATVGDVHVETDKEREEHRMLLARAAFALMDANGDGELSRFEMQRAFRLDERVRELMLPLLPISTVSKNSTANVDLQEQLDGFDALFNAMDTDKSNEVSREEFELFFKRSDNTKSNKTKTEAAIARQRIMRPLAGWSVAGADPATVVGKSITAKPGAPRFDTLMRRSSLNTWRKPMAEQVPTLGTESNAFKPGGKMPLHVSASRPRTPSGLPAPMRSSSRAPSRSGLLPVDEAASSSAALLAQTPLTLGPGHAKAAKLAAPLQPSASRPAITSGTAATKLPTSASMPALAKPLGSVATSTPKKGVPLPAAAALTEPKRSGALSRLRTAGKIVVIDQRVVSGGDHLTERKGKSASNSNTWQPNVREIAATPSEIDDSLFARLSTVDAATGEEGSSTLRPFERRYLEKAEQSRLRFKVELPKEEQHAKSRYTFDSGKVSKADPEGAKTAKLISWVGNAHSTVGNAIAPPFAMPNGDSKSVLRLFHAEQKRNARTPTAEHTEPVGDGLHATLLDFVPLRPMCPYIELSDVPRITQTMELVPPRPMYSTLEPPGYGEIRGESFSLTIQPTSKSFPGDEAGVLVLEKSAFAPRKETSDGHAFLTSPALLMRAFNIDWARASTAGFLKFITNEENGGLVGADEEMSEMGEVLSKHAPKIYTAFQYYALHEPHYDGFVMGITSYMHFVRQCKLIDMDSKFTNARALERIFSVVTFEQTEARGASPSSSSQEMDPAQASVLSTLMRFEFMACIVRIAIAKYVRSGLEADISTAIERFMERDLLPHLPPEATRDFDTFRTRRFYTLDVDAALRQHDATLKALFEYYSIAEDTNVSQWPPACGPQEHTRRMSIDGWISLLKDAGILPRLSTPLDVSFMAQRSQALPEESVDDNDDEHVAEKESSAHLGQIGAYQARNTFALSLAFCTDSAKRREKHTQADFVDFCEALCRLTTRIQLPDSETLLRYRVKSVGGFYAKVAQGDLDGAAVMNARGGWLAEETSDEPVAPAFEMLLALITERVEESALAKIGEKKMERLQLEKSRQEQVLKRVRLLEKHEALPLPAPPLQEDASSPLVKRRNMEKAMKRQPRRSTLYGLPLR